MENFPDLGESKLIAHTQNDLMCERQTYNDSSKHYIFAAQRKDWRHVPLGIPLIPICPGHFLFYGF